MANASEHATPRRTILVANPSADTYGSDLQMLESVGALVDRQHDVVVATAEDGPLVGMLTEQGARTRLVRFPVVRRRNASPLGIIQLAAAAMLAIPRMLKVISRVGPDVIYVNTMTIPWWSVAARLSRVPVVVHIHEAEADDPRLLRLALNCPLMIANKVIVNSATSRAAMTEVVPALARRAVLIHNGVNGPDEAPTIRHRRPDDPLRATVIGRLSPRKATDSALRAVALLRSQGIDVVLDVAGTAFEGYEWYVEELEQLARTPELDGAVTFLGYVNPIWPILERSDVVIAPSVRESLGNAVIESQLAERPVVATATTGHLESIDDDSNGLLVPVGDVEALASAISRLLEDGELAARLAARGRSTAENRFSTARYNRQITELIESIADTRVRRD